MKHQFNSYLWFLIPWLVSCGQLGPLTNSGASGTPPTEDVSTLNVDAENGAEISIADTSSEIAGAEVSIPPGALAIDTQITVEVGSSLVDTEVAGTLDLGEDNEVTEAGPSVIVLPEELTNPAQPLQLAIPLTGTGSQLTALNYAVLYKVQKEDGSFFLGLFTNVTLDGNKLRFSTSHFGAFQAITLTTPLTSDREVKTIVPISKKREASEFDGIWTKQCENKDFDSSDKSATRSETSQLSLSAGKLIYRGIEYFDENCKNRKFTHQILADYKVGDDVPAIAGAKDLDIIFKKIFITIGSPTEAEYFNAANFCGFQDWKAGEPKDIGDCELHSENEKSDSNQDDNEKNADGTLKDDNSDDNQKDDDHGCDNRSEPKVGKELYTILKKENNKLYLGQEEDSETCEQYGDTPDHRPVSLEDSFLERT